MIIFLSGLLAGGFHVLSGPDHLAAIAPLTARSPQGARALGAVWGLGHGGGVLLWFVVAGIARARYGVELTPDALEALIGLTLIGLGLLHWGADREASSEGASRGTLFALAVGALHGSAGASHLLSLLPTLGLPLAGVAAYVSGYLTAGIVAMAFAASLLGRASARYGEAMRLRRLFAAVAIAIGAGWLVAASWL